MNLKKITALSLILCLVMAPAAQATDLIKAGIDKKFLLSNIALAFVGATVSAHLGGKALKIFQEMTHPTKKKLRFKTKETDKLFSDTTEKAVFYVICLAGGFALKDLLGHFGIMNEAFIQKHFGR